MNRVVGLGMVVLLALTLGACSSATTTKGGSSDQEEETSAKATVKLSPVKHVKVDVFHPKGNDSSVYDGFWQVSGTTKAPAGTKIMGTKEHDEADDSPLVQSKDQRSWAKVDQNGHFTVLIDPKIFIGADESPVAGAHFAIRLFAIQGYKEDYDDARGGDDADDEGGTIRELAAKEISETLLPLSQSQSDQMRARAKNSKQVESSIEQSHAASKKKADAESSETDANDGPKITYKSVPLPAFAENPEKYVGQNIETSGTVLLVQKNPSDEDTYLVAIAPEDTHTTSGISEGHGTPVIVNVDLMNETPLNVGDRITVDGGAMTNKISYGGRTIKSAIVADKISK